MGWGPKLTPTVRHLSLFLTSSLCRSEHVHFALRWPHDQSADVDRGMVSFSSCGCRKDEKWPTGLTEVVLVQLLRRLMRKRVRLTLSGLALR